MTLRDEIIAKLKEGKVLANKCRKCNNLQLVTTVFCENCNSKDLEAVELEGTGKVLTFTIQNVPPEEYEKYASYAWVVVQLDAGLKISGFMPGIASSKDLALNSKVKIVGYDERGILLEKVE